MLFTELQKKISNVGNLIVNKLFKMNRSHMCHEFSWLLSNFLKNFWLYIIFYNSKPIEPKYLISLQTNKILYTLQIIYKINIYYIKVYWRKTFVYQTQILGHVPNPMIKSDKRTKKKYRNRKDLWMIVHTRHSKPRKRENFFENAQTIYKFKHC